MMDRQHAGRVITLAVVPVHLALDNTIQPGKVVPDDTVVTRAVSYCLVVVVGVSACLLFISGSVS